MKNKEITLITVSVVLLFFLFSTQFHFAQANPLTPPYITVSSPKNYQTYQSSTVLLNFTRTSVSKFNFTSFTYSLDGQDLVESNGTSLLTDLSAGSHRLVIFGTGNYASQNINDVETITLEKIQFSIFYSTEMVLAVGTLSASISVLAVMVYLTRKRIKSVFKARKTRNFWLGSLLLIIGVSFMILTLSWMIHSYLHPNPYTYNSYALVIALTVLFSSSGIFFMKKGIKKQIL